MPDPSLPSRFHSRESGPTFRRIAAIAGIISAFVSIPGMILFPVMKDAFDPTTLSAGLSALGAHQTAVVVDQWLWGISNTAQLVFVLGLATVDRDAVRGGGFATLGAVFIGLWSLVDNVIVALIIAVADGIAPQAAHDPAMHAIGIGFLQFLTTVEALNGWNWVVGFTAFGIFGWRSRLWPRWVAVTAFASAMLMFLGMCGISLVPTVEYWLLEILPSIWLAAASVFLWKSSEAPMIE